MEKTLIRCAHLIRPGEGDLSPAWIGLSDGRFAHVGDSSPAEGWEDAVLIDAADLIAAPGLINAHAHIGMTVMRGAADDMLLMPWLSEKIWPMEAAMSGEDRYWSGRLAALEMLRGGITSFADMSPDADRLAAACRDMGIRAWLSEVLLETQDADRETLRRAAAFAGEWNRSAERVRMTMGPHAQYTCSDDYLAETAKLAGDLDLIVQVHLSETEGEVESCRRDHGGQSPVELLAALGLFRQPTLAAHCVFLSDHDREIMADHEVSAVHNPSSNMKMAAGAMDLAALDEGGINVALGTDSTASNNNLSMFQEMRSAALMQKLRSGDPTLAPAARLVEMATVGGARALGVGESLGRVAQGYQADLVLIDPTAPHARPVYDPTSHMAYAFAPTDVDTVIVGGDVLLKRGEFVSIDAEEIYARCDEIAVRLRGC